jgi:hypothetical protein
LGDKVLKGWLDVGVPTTFKGVQKLVGKLNFASPFVVNYKKVVAPIEKLLSRKTISTWG